MSAASTLNAEKYRAKQGMWLLVASLGIFFFASMLLYIVYIALRLDRAPDAEQLFVLPRMFWISTGLLLIVSAALHLSIGAARRDKFVDVTIRVSIAMIASIAFLVIQSEAMAYLIIETKALGNTGTSPYPYTLILALLHALHVLAGLFGLAVVQIKAFMQRYDHERYTGLEVCAIYWHFLDVVWLIMLASFYIASGIFNAA